MTVRARTTVLALLVFTTALVVAGLALIGVLRRTMIDNIDVALSLRAQDLGALVQNGTPPADVAIEDEEDGLVQFVSSGEVIASSSNIDGEGPVVALAVGTLSTINVHAVDDSQLRIIVVETTSPDGPVIIIVGTTLENVDDTLATATQTLLIGIPVLLTLAGVLTWFAIGRGLRPVEAIRAEVAEIGATDLHRRVPQPSSNDEIGRLAGTMNDMLDRIESGTLRQQRFVSDASHELRTPIAIIRHELEVGLRDRESSDWPAIAEDILEEDLRMQRLVDDLLWLARHDQAAAPAKRSLVDLDEIASAQGRRYQGESKVVVDTTGIGAGQVRGSADDLTRVVQNLLNNAVRHATKCVRLEVETSDDGRVLLRVEDDGPGVPVDQRTSILERFTRSDEARNSDSGGAGLGLAIVTEIVDEHDGLLTIDDSQLGGARFSVDLADARSA